MSGAPEASLADSRSNSDDDVRQRTAFRDRRPNPADVDLDAVRFEDQLLSLQPDAADDDLGGADQLTDFDDRGAAERRGRRQVQLLERVDPLRPPDRGKAPRVELVGDQQAGGFGDPVEPWLAPGIVERHDQDPVTGRLRRRGRRHRQREQDDARSGEATRHARVPARPARVGGR